MSKGTETAVVTYQLTYNVTADSTDLALNFELFAEVARTVLGMNDSAPLHIPPTVTRSETASFTPATVVTCSKPPSA